MQRCSHTDSKCICRACPGGQLLEGRLELYASSQTYVWMCMHICKMSLSAVLVTPRVPPVYSRNKRSSNPDIIFEITN
jgi:hypothetical protein